MLFKFAKTLLLLTIVIVLPLAPKIYLAGTWPIIATFLAGLLLDQTQPSVTKQNLSEKDPRDQRSILLLFLSALLCFLVPVLDYGYGRQARHGPFEIWSLVGLFLTFGGLAFRIWSIRTLGKFFTAKVEIQADHKVIDSGPYKFLRHPSYAGAFAMAVGISLIFRSYAGLAVCFLIFFPAYMYRIAMEEKALAQELGDAYTQYQKRTSRLVPGIY